MSQESLSLISDRHNLTTRQAFTLRALSLDSQGSHCYPLLTLANLQQVFKGARHSGQRIIHRVDLEDLASHGLLDCEEYVYREPNIMAEHWTVTEDGHRLASLINLSIGME